ncbi:peptide chain release factor N(5)-glutamine methyltransferase [Mycolicibacterium lacusdiani]|uniref:peptide chain release factor N(5)-glutamine methyltransferase n=1 Tax=Mycolicibacterium lacusdiani TaxID=2895283 RepID=UPI00201CAE01
MRHAVAQASDVLAAAGVGSARADAEQLAAHVAGVDRGRLFLTEPDDDFYPRFRELVDARARRIPLQHLIGSAAFGPVTVGVGPGVFVPRPETESLLEWAMAQPLPERPVIVDLCTGSGALAVALARALPTATVIAVDDSPEALAYARRNVAGTAVELVAADVTADGLLAGRDGVVDLIVANPPYIPDGAELESEVADHDPHHALFGGPDGMAVIEPIVAHAVRLLRRGGWLGVEHDDTTSGATAAVFDRSGAFTDVTPRRDLAGRPRFVTATRAG